MKKSEYANDINANVIKITRQRGSNILIVLSYDSSQQIKEEKISNNSTFHLKSKSEKFCGFYIS